MTNYNERLDDVLSNFRQSSLIINANNSMGVGEKGREAFIQSLDEAKQAIASLIKELVTEAKPTRSDFIIYGDLSKRDLNIIDQFEQNLLKALEQL